jgi:hypothetical protein
VEERYRLAVLTDGRWQPHRYPDVFGRDGKWLAAAPSGSPLELLVTLLDAMVPPYRAELEVLDEDGLDLPAGHVAAVGSELSREALVSWLRKNAELLESDARLAVIVHGAAGERAVYDEHNRLLLEGPVESFEQLLLTAGLAPGDPSVPMPHSHHYREDKTEELRKLTTYH